MNTMEKLTAREQVLRDYDVSNGRIVSPGKFEGEPVFAPHYWGLALEGCADRDDGQTFTFRFTATTSAEDYKQWPELKQWLGRRFVLNMREDEQGFVRCY